MIRRCIGWLGVCLLLPLTETGCSKAPSTELSALHRSDFHKDFVTYLHGKADIVSSEEQSWRAIVEENKVVIINLRQSMEKTKELFPGLQEELIRLAKERGITFKNADKPYVVPNTGSYAVYYYYTLPSGTEAAASLEITEWHSKFKQSDDKKTYSIIGQGREKDSSALVVKVTEKYPAP